MPEQFVPVLGGAIAGLLPTILTAIVSWLNNRSLQSRRTQALAIAQQRIAFLDDWIKAQEGLCTPDRLDQIKGAVSDELNDLRLQLADVLEDHRRPPEQIIAERTFLQKALLVYTPRTGAAWVFHTLFYMSLATGAVLGFLTALGSSTTDAQSVYVTIGCFVVPTLILAFIFRQVAIEVERRAVQADKAVTAAPAPAEAAPRSASAAGD
ncbi:MAG TPA: hypothetical protein VF784_14165 [Anaerolineales bacterium]